MLFFFGSMWVVFIVGGMITTLIEDWLHKRQKQFNVEEFIKNSSV